MLKDLISPPQLADLDPALVPAILQVFIDALADDDSFLYLNAIAGLETLSRPYGSDVVNRLITVYAKPSEAYTNLAKAQRALDTSLRAAEALGQIVKSTGQAMSAYGSKYSLCIHRQPVFRFANV